MNTAITCSRPDIHNLSISPNSVNKYSDNKDILQNYWLKSKVCGN
jgi:hypothetical protein